MAKVRRIYGMATPHDYVELRARSAFSFLEASSNPEDLVEAAVALGHETLALADRDGVSSAPRFHRAARAAGLQALTGSLVSVEATPSLDGPPPSLEPDRILVLCETREGWRRHRVARRRLPYV